VIRDTSKERLARVRPTPQFGAKPFQSAKRSRTSASRRCFIWCAQACIQCTSFS